MDLARLANPFPAQDIEWRLQAAGTKDGKIWARCLAYITNRAIQERLDAVCGPGNWKNEYIPWEIGTPGVLCGISIYVPRNPEAGGYNEWVTKWDGAEQTDIEAMKGGLSAAMKRAAVQWGIGRYLYDLEAGFARVSEDGKHRGKTPEGQWFRWDPPELPAWAVPARPDHEREPVHDSGLMPKQQLQVSAASTVQLDASAVPVVKPGPYAPSEKQVNFYLKLLNSHVFTEDERKQALDWLATKATRQTIKDQIDWLKAMVEGRKAKEAVASGGGSDEPPLPDEPPPWVR